MDYFKILQEDGKTFDQWKKKSQIPKAEESINRIIKSSRSDYPLRALGVGDTELLISEEEREANFHIIGQPRQGKSKFIEHNIRRDIELGNGLCLLDPSDNGDTCKKILRYCALNGIEKVVYIDPDTLFRFGKIATIQPLKPQYLTKSVDSVMEAVNNVFGVARETDTPRIRRYLPSLLTVLANNDMTLYEAKYFRRYRDAKELPFLGYDEDSMIIRDGFRSDYTFENYFLSTVGRLDIFRKEPISLMIGANTGIDFIQMIRDGWVILVNLFPGKYLTVTQARLLGILMISEIIHAVDTLFHNGWRGVHYLYMDEAARFATPQIEQLLSYKGKTGLRLIIAHHHFSQFRDKEVLDAIKQGCRIKMMFNISSYKDRLEMVEDLGYGGDIPPLLASYANQNIPKQQMIIKADKATPVRVRVPDVSDIPDSELSSKQLDQYIEELLQQPWYLTKEEITNQINQRYQHNDRSVQPNTESSESRKVPYRKAAKPTAVPKGIQEREQQQSVSKSNEKPQNSGKRKPIKI
jgi:hypothetical protein